MADTAQSTLTDIRLTLAPALAAAAAFDGWSEAAVQAAAVETGIDPEVAHYAFAEGPMAMISAWIAHVDLAMAGALPAGALAAMPVRERVRSLIVARLDAQRGYEEALRRAQSIMALPGNAAQSLRLGWQTADAIWRLAGDRATDYNHYTKRVTLTAVYAATLSVFIGDDTAGKADTLAFLDRRIAGIMRFEKAKARLTKPQFAHFSPVRLLGRLRYPAN